MAKASSKKKTKKSGLLALMIIASCIFFSGYMIVFCAMMVPTLAAWIGDKDKSKRMAVTVGALNLTGTLPVLLDLYYKGGQVGTSFHEIADPLNWIIVFLATLVGWVMAQVGMPFVHFWDSTVTVVNKAKNGRSTKRFLSEGLWKSIMNEAKEGDYVIIQFGHNDESVEKKERYATPDTFKM